MPVERCTESAFLFHYLFRQPVLSSQWHQMESWETFMQGTKGMMHYICRRRIYPAGCAGRCTAHAKPGASGRGGSRAPGNELRAAHAEHRARH